MTVEHEDLMNAGADFLMTRYAAMVDGEKQIVATVDEHGNINLTEAGETLLQTEGVPKLPAVKAAVNKAHSRSRAKVNPVVEEHNPLLDGDELL